MMESSEKRTAEYRISNCRISKGGLALLSHLYKKDHSAQKLTTGRIPYFDIRYSLYYMLLAAEISLNQQPLNPEPLNFEPLSPWTPPRNESNLIRNLDSCGLRSWQTYPLHINDNILYFTTDPQVFRKVILQTYTVWIKSQKSRDISTVCRWINIIKIK